MTKSKNDPRVANDSHMAPVSLDPALPGRLRNLSDADLHREALGAARCEQGATLALLSHLDEVERRGLYLAYGFSSLWDYVMRYLGYSAASASERVRAMRLLRGSAEAKEMLESGALTLTTAAKVQSFLTAVQKTENRKLEVGEKKAVLAQVEGKSSREVDQILFDRAPHAARPKEMFRPLGRGLTEVRVVVDEEMLRLLERAKRVFRTVDQVETLRAVLRFAVARKEKEMGEGGPVAPAQVSAPRPVRAPEPSVPVGNAWVGPAVSRTVPRAVQRDVWGRSSGRCEWVDPATGIRCVSEHRLEFDHIQPFALGGGNGIENIRLLCRAHNVIAAEMAGLNVGPREQNGAPPAA